MYAYKFLTTPSPVKNATLPGRMTDDFCQSWTHDTLIENLPLSELEYDKSGKVGAPNQRIWSEQSFPCLMGHARQQKLVWVHLFHSISKKVHKCAWQSPTGDNYRQHTTSVHGYTNNAHISTHHQGVCLTGATQWGSWIFERLITWYDHVMCVPRFSFGK